jgi:hypothetical protein
VVKWTFVVVVVVVAFVDVELLSKRASRSNFQRALATLWRFFLIIGFYELGFVLLWSITCFTRFIPSRHRRRCCCCHDGWSALTKRACVGGIVRCYVLSSSYEFFNSIHRTINGSQATLRLVFMWWLLTVRLQYPQTFKKFLISPPRRSVIP